MMPFDSPFQEDRGPQQVVSPGKTPEDITPSIGITPPLTLAQEAASGRRGAAWRLFHWIMENDPRATQAVASLQDDRLAQNLVEFIALGTWAGKPFVMPASLRSPYARTRLRTLFVSASGINPARSERVLLADLHDNRPAVRETAIYILGIMGSTVAVPELIAALHDPVHSVRMQAAKALGRSGSPAAVQALLEALHGADEQLSSQIFQALVNLGHVATPALLDLSLSTSPWMRWHGIRALCEMREQKAFPILVQALNDPDHSVAWMAAKGLAPFGKDCILPVLQLLTRAEMTPWLVETASYVLKSQYQANPDLKPYLEPVVQHMHQPSYRTATGYTALKAQENIEAAGALR